MHSSFQIFIVHLKQMSLSRDNPNADQFDQAAIRFIFGNSAHLGNIDEILQFFGQIGPLGQGGMVLPPGIFHPPEPLPEENNSFWEPVHVRIHPAELRKFICARRMTPTLLKEVGEAEGEVMKCTICMQAMSRMQFVYLTKCNHIFHKKCLTEWLTNKCEKPVCPMCRADIRSAPVAN